MRYYKNKLRKSEIIDFRNLKKRAQSSDEKLNQPSKLSRDTVLGDLVDFYPGVKGKLKKRSLDLIQHLLFIRKANINVCNGEGGTPIHRAIINNTMDICFLIIATRKADINWQDEHGNTPLHHCAREGHVKMARLLLLYGAKLFIKNHSGENCFDVAIEYQQSGICRFLATNIDPETGHAILMQEALAGTSEITERLSDLWRIRTLVGAGININYRGVGGKTILHLACIHLASIAGFGRQYTEDGLCKIDLLISLGARLDIADDQGRTPMSYMAESRSLSILFGKKSAPDDVKGLAASRSR